MKIARVYEQTDEEKAASKRGKKSKRKGGVFEREMVNFFRETLSDAWHVQRLLQSRGGAGLPDIEIVLGDRLLLHAECKHSLRPNIWRAMDQARHDAHRGAVPIAITKQTNGYTLVTMDLADFASLLAMLNKEEES